VLNISLRDLAPELIFSSFNFVDDVEHVLQAETSLHLALKESGARDFISGTLGDLVLGSCEVDRSRPIIFSPFGLGVLDVALGKWIYDRAEESGQLRVIEDFFFDLAR
jgi:ornithine cyclodeaminase